MELSKLSALITAACIAFPSLAVMKTDIITKTYAADTVTFSQFDTRINGGEPIRGVDISSVIAIEKAGVRFYDENGNEQDIFRTLAEHGVNYIRVRVWNDPYDADGNSYGGGNSDVYTAGLIGKRASQYGMKLLVDIQYSDFWADPEKQTRPKYWQQHDHDTLKGEIYKWTTWVLTSITEAGGDIGMVQVGNETNCFFCGETDMYKICDLFASGNKAVRDFDKNILIAHHFANPSTGYYDWYAKVMDECRLDYDVFATSYYPYWHGTTDNLTKVLKGIGDKYNKYVMVAETAYPYTSEDGDNFGNAVSAGSSGCDFRYDISVDGQAQCLTDVFKAVAATGSHGIGVFYWEPAWLGVPDISWSEQNELWKKYGSGWATDYAGQYDKSADKAGGSSYDNQGLFDFHGKPLPSLDVFKNIYPQSQKQLPAKKTSVPEGAYRIKNAASGLYLTVSEGDASDGANVVQYSADGMADYNVWNISDAGGGYYNISSALGGGNEFMLAVDQGKKDDRANVGIYSGASGNSAQFGFSGAGDGKYIIVTKASGDMSAVEVKDALTSDDANVQQFTLNGNDCQAWILEPAEEFASAGDLDSSGSMDVFDLILLKQAVIDGRYSFAADVNGDDEVNVSDLVAFSKFIHGREKITHREHGTPHNTIFPRKK